MSQRREETGRDGLEDLHHWQHAGYVMCGFFFISQPRHTEAFDKLVLNH